MGYYVNPNGQTKEQFLAKHGVLVEKPTFAGIPSGHMLVGWVNNGWMTAAGIAYSEAEFNEFMRSDDPRPRKNYHVPIAALKALGDPEIDRMFKHLEKAA